MNLSKTKEAEKSKTSDDKSGDQSCIVCKRINDKKHKSLLLSCSNCNRTYHGDCVKPKILKKPSCEWLCPQCLRAEIFNPKEGFGLPDSEKEYTIEEFRDKANKFKTDYFGSISVPFEKVEDEFWKITTNFDEDVIVEYGTDIHTLEHGSGFPKDDEKDPHSKSLWNLNNLPLTSDCVLSYISSKITGIMVPWLYVGMCFSTFCWHIEDHWTYSCNYMHFGEAKTWYGVPAAYAEELENVMKENAPELFESQPDLLHQLVTILNPSVLLEKNIPVYRVHQEPGEFVITFPRVYHAGFNQGFNCNEAVNFATGDWISMGRLCLESYSNVKRNCAFSHDELITNMAMRIDAINVNTIVPCYADFIEMLHQEVVVRKDLRQCGLGHAEIVHFEDLPDENRKCHVCNTILYLSSVYCSQCNVQSCLRHAKQLCSCSSDKLMMRTRFSFDEIFGILKNLKHKVDLFEKWLKKARIVVNRDSEVKLKFHELETLIAEGKNSRSAKTRIFSELESYYKDAKKAQRLVGQLKIDMYRIKTRTNQNEEIIKLSLEDLNALVCYLDELRCIIEDAVFIKELQQIGYELKIKIKKILDMQKIYNTDPNDLKKLLDEVDNSLILFTERHQLKVRLKQVEWYFDWEKYKYSCDTYSIEVLEKILQEGLKVSPDPIIESELTQIQWFVMKALAWESHIAELFENDSDDLEDLEKLGELLSNAAETKCILPSYDIIKDIFIAKYDMTYSSSQEEETDIDIVVDDDLPTDLSMPKPSTSHKRGRPRKETVGIVGKSAEKQKPLARRDSNIVLPKKKRNENPRSNSLESMSFEPSPKLSKLTDNLKIPLAHTNVTPLENAPVDDKDQIKKLSSETDESDEICSHPHCKRPFGSAIDWIQCDKCNRWYHVVCLELKESPDPEASYVCVLCYRPRGRKGKPKKFEAAAPSLDIKMEELKLNQTA